MIDIWGVVIAVVSALIGAIGARIAYLQLRHQRATSQRTSGASPDEIAETIRQLRGARSGVVAAGLGLGGGILVDDAYHHHGAPGDLGDADPDATHGAPDLLHAIGNGLRMAWEFVT